MKHQNNLLQTPEDKALQMIDRYKNLGLDFDMAKKCASLAIFEIIDLLIEKELDSAYQQEIRFFLAKIGTGEMEARADRFNEDLWRN